MIEPLKNVLYIARRFKLATAFNLIGLIVAFAAFYLMMTQIRFQWTYNHGIKDCERLYRVDTDFLNNNGLFSDNIFYPIADVLDSMPEVESYSLTYRTNDDPVFGEYFNLQFLKNKVDTINFTYQFYCNETAVSTLTSKALSGSIQWSSTDHGSKHPGIIIPKSIAEEYFGKIDVAGDSMLCIDSAEPHFLTVYGVYEDFPVNSELKSSIFEMINDKEKAYNKHYLGPDYKCIIKFKQVPQNVDTLNNRIKQGIIELMDREGWEDYASEAAMSVEFLQQTIQEMHISLTPLEDSYFETKNLSSGKHGFKPMHNILMLVSLLLILIATIHFLNFTLLESPMRMRGINTRLVLGASRLNLKLGIIAECVITAIIACVIALMVCSVLSSWSGLKQIIDGNLELHNHWLLALFTLFIACVTGAIAGVYPANFVTSIIPAMALKGDFGLTPQGRKLRKALIAFQLFVSFLMVIYLGILIMEQFYIYKSPYNYHKDNVLISTLPTYITDSTRQQLYKELTAIQGVKNMSLSDGSLGLSDIHGAYFSEVPEGIISYDYTAVDTAYLNTMGIGTIEGRKFLPTDTAVAIINKSAREKWGWLKIGQSKIPSDTNNDSLTVVGVCDNIRFNSTRNNSNQPFAFILDTNSSRRFLNLSVDRNADNHTIAKANAILKKHFKMAAKPLIPFDKKLHETYKDEFRYFKWIFLLSIVCTVIMLIGVVCLMMFESEHRRKEIGIRKIVGATTGEVVWMLCKQYIPLILISFVLAAPIARLSGLKTLERFYDHTESIWWVFPLALVIVGGIVMVTILLQSWRTARENPVNSIKSE